MYPDTSPETSQAAEGMLGASPHRRSLMLFYNHFLSIFYSQLETQM